MTDERTVTLTLNQLDELIAKRVQAAVASLPSPKGERKGSDPEKDAKREAYIQSKKDVALKLMREKGVHYNLYAVSKGKILIFSDFTVDKARRTGATAVRNLGTRLWSTIEDGHSLKEAAVG